MRGNLAEMRRSRGTGVALLLAALLVGAQANAADTPLVTEAIINAPVAEVWKLFTTGPGLETWRVGHADIELKVGGLLRTHPDPKGALGDERTSIEQILSFEPQRMLSLKVQRPGSDFAYPRALQGVWSVTYLQPLEPGMTNVRIVSLGYSDDPESQQLRAYVGKSNAEDLERLQRRFRPLCARCEKEKAAAARP